MSKTKTSEKQLTREAFLALCIYELTHAHPKHWHWHWLCLSDEARQEMLDDASAEYEKWKVNELAMEERRKVGPGEKR